VEGTYDAEFKESKVVRYSIVYAWKTDDTLDMATEINDDERRMALLGGVAWRGWADARFGIVVVIRAIRTAFVIFLRFVGDAPPSGSPFPRLGLTWSVKGTGSVSNSSRVRFLLTLGLCVHIGGDDTDQ